jgi:hypothetical protein
MFGSFVSYETGSHQKLCKGLPTVMSSLEELKGALRDTLAARGSLGQIQARVRAEIFNALEETVVFETPPTPRQNPLGAGSSCCVSSLTGLSSASGRQERVTGQHALMRCK